jgi:bacteriocin-like protein
MTNTINTSATSKQVREPTDRELTADELEHVSGGKEGPNRLQSGCWEQQAVQVQ